MLGRTTGAFPGQINSGFFDAFLVNVVPSDLSLTVTASPTYGFAPLDVTYTYDVTNTGDSGLTDVSISDNLCSPVSPASVATVDPDASAVFTCTQTFNSAGSITNIATATATTPTGNALSATSSTTVNVSFFVVAESPIGSAAMVASSLAALGAFAFFRYSRKGSNRP